MLVNHTPGSFHSHSVGPTWRWKWKWSRSVMSNSLRPMNCSLPSSSVHGILQARILEWVAISFSRRSSQPRDQTQVSYIAGRHFNLCATREANESCSVVSDSLWPHGLYSPWYSPGQNTGVDSLSLLQGIFPTQELNPYLLHCRRILYLLSHKGRPTWKLLPKYATCHKWHCNRLQN